MKKFWFLSLFALLLIPSLAFALTAPTGGVSYYRLSNMYDLWDNYNATNQGTSSTLTYPSFNSSGNGAPNSSLFNPTSDDYIDTNYRPPNSQAYSITGWVNFDNVGSIHAFATSIETTTSRDGFQLKHHNTAGWNYNVFNSDSVISGGSSGSPQASVNTWYFFALTANNTNISLYIDGDVELSTSGTYTLSHDIAVTLGREYESRTTNDHDGELDEIQLFNRSLSKTEVRQLYNTGNLTVTPTPTASNDSTESTSVVKQVGSVSFTGAMTTIFSSDFNVSVNNTPLYGGYSLEVLTTGSNVMYCELLIDSVVKTNKTRSNTAGDTGSFFIQFPTEIFENGTYTQTLQCQRQSGVGLTTVSESVGIGHFLVDSNNDTLPYNSTVVSASTTGASYTLIDSFNITTGNKTSTNHNYSLVLEGMLEYENTGVSSQLLSTYMSINSSNCSMYPRTTAASATASVGIDCILENATENTTYQINIYGNGTATYTGNAVAKALFLSDEEVVGGTGILTGYTFSGDSTTEIFNTTGGNLNHAVANTFVKVSYSITTDLDTDVNLWIVIENGSSYTTKNFSRSFVAGETGVMIGHDILESLPQDNYTIYLYGNCGNAAATCTISGGQSGGYLTDVVTTIVNAFNVTLYDSWDNSSIQNFTVVNGGTWNTSQGWVLVFSEDAYENLTISANNYFSETVLNHNTSNDLNQSMNQSLISFSAFELLSNASLSGAVFEVSDGVIFKNTSSVISLKAGSYVVSAYKSGYFKSSPVSFNVSSLDVKTVDATGLYDWALNIFVRDAANNTITNNSVLYINGSLYPSDFNSSIGLLRANLTGGSYLASVLPSGYAFNNQTVVNGSAPYNGSFYSYHYTTNSILFFFRNEDSLELVNETTVYVELISDVVSYNFSTSNGSLYVDLLNPQEYNIRYSASGYSQRDYFFTMVDYSFNNITLYLGNRTTLTNVTVNVFDTLQNPLVGAKVSVLKFDPSSGSYLLVSIKEANFAGKFVEAMELGTEYYKFIVEYENSIVLTTTASYIYETPVSLYANLLTSGFDDLFTFTGLFGVISYVNGSASFTWSDGDGLASQGCLFAYQDTINGFVLNGSVCASGAANTVYLPVTNTTGLTYLLKGYVTKNGQSFYLTNYWLSFKEKLDVGRQGLILSFILLTVLIFVAYWNLELAVMMAGIGVLILSVTQIILLDVSYGISLFMLSLVTAYVINRSRSRL